MNLFETETLLLFCGGGLLLCLAAIVIDRFNFPQRRFRPKRIAVNANGPRRDRTGAHVLDESHRAASTSASPEPPSSSRADDPTGTIDPTEKTETP